MSFVRSSKHSMSSFLACSLLYVYITMSILQKSMGILTCQLKHRQQPNLNCSTDSRHARCPWRHSQVELHLEHLFWNRQRVHSCPYYTRGTRISVGIEWEEWYIRFEVIGAQLLDCLANGEVFQLDSFIVYGFVALRTILWWKRLNVLFFYYVIIWEFHIEFRAVAVTRVLLLKIIWMRAGGMGCGWLRRGARVRAWRWGWRWVRGKIQPPSRNRLCGSLLSLNVAGRSIQITTRIRAPSLFTVEARCWRSLSSKVWAWVRGFSC